MSKNFHPYVIQIVEKLDGNEAEKADFYEELIIHLQLSYEQLLEAGYDKKQAEQMAIKSFGDANHIGNQIQEAIYPYRKIMFLTLAIASLLYSFIIYTVQLFSEGDAHFVWLVFSIMTSSLLLLFALQYGRFLDRKRNLNIILFCHIFIYLYGYFLASSLTRLSIPFSFLAIFILILAVALVYRTTIYDFPSALIEENKQIKQLHFLNLTFGFIIMSATLFFIWAFLAFSDIPNLSLFYLLIPFVIWVIAYFIQLKLVGKGKKKIAYIVTIIPFLFAIMILLWFSGVLY